MLEPVTIRRAIAEDWRPYRELRLRSLHIAPDAYGSNHADELAMPETWWRERLIGSHTLVAEDAGRAVGIGTGIGDRHEVGSREIVGLWVEPEVRGRGVATSLIEGLAAWARADGAGAIALWVADGNDAALRLYQARGFMVTGERDLVRGTLMEERMRRSLEPRDSVRRSGSRD